MDLVHGMSSYLLTPSTGNDGDTGLKGGETGGLFSPMDSSNTSGASLQLCSGITPKRRLSMDLDESTQDGTDSGYGRGSSVSSSLSQDSSLSAALESSVGSEMSTRTPLGELPVNCSQGKPLQARRAKVKRSIFMGEQGKDKKPLSLHLSDRPSSLPSLPCLPLTQDPSCSQKPTLLHQISSPLERMSLQSPNPASQFPGQSISRLRVGSIESDGYPVFDSEEYSENSLPVPLSSGLTTLINAPFSHFSAMTGNEACSKPTAHSTPVVLPTPMRPSFHRCESWSPSITQGRRTSLKRTSPCPESSQLLKRRRPPLPVFSSNSQDSAADAAKLSPLKGVQLLRSQSCSMGSGEHFTYPVSPGSDNGKMIGDFSKTCALPLVKGTVADLKCISPCTLAELLRDPQASSVDHVHIVDCRYPYEYKGGHIRGAQNIWEKDVFLKQFFTEPQYMPESERRIIIFHCEFSSKRGPEMSRFMRKTDRERNGMEFPKLYYPELYLLDGGYKAFYAKYPELCEPNSYVTMLDDNHKDALKHFKQRSKSWNGGEVAASKRRLGQLRPRRSTVDSNHATSSPLNCVSSHKS